MQGVRKSTARCAFSQARAQACTRWPTREVDAHKGCPLRACHRWIHAGTARWKKLHRRRILSHVLAPLKTKADVSKRNCVRKTYRYRLSALRCLHSVVRL